MDLGLMSVDDPVTFHVSNACLGLTQDMYHFLRV